MEEKQNTCKVSGEREADRKKPLEGLRPKWEDNI
jgi:hypothetical protein